MRTSSIGIWNFCNDFVSIVHSQKEDFIKVAFWKLLDLNAWRSSYRCSSDLCQFCHVELNITRRELCWLIPEPSARCISIEGFSINIYKINGRFDQYLSGLVMTLNLWLGRQLKGPSRGCLVPAYGVEGVLAKQNRSFSNPWKYCT